jgi:hypothetical protein
MARKPAFRTPVYSRQSNRLGISYAMQLPSLGSELAPMVPIPVRSSLAQMIQVFRTQYSHYISHAKRGAVPMDYPVAKVLTLVNTAPKHRRRVDRPVGGVKGHPARQGYMSAPPRFRKALRLPVNDYTPPVYGG